MSESGEENGEFWETHGENEVAADEDVMRFLKEDDDGDLLALDTVRTHTFYRLHSI